MANVLNRTTKQYKRSVNTPDYPTADWIINPDMSGVDGVPKKYWKISGDTVSEMDTSEKATADDDLRTIRDEQGTYIDYKKFRDTLIEKVDEKGFSNLAVEEKRIACEHAAVIVGGSPYNNDYDTTSMVTFYIVEDGMTQPQAEYTVLGNIHTSHGGVVSACYERWVAAKKVAMQYLNEIDQTDFAKSTESLKNALIDYSILGLNYGQKDDGIMDFIESTNYFEEAGLREKNYTIISSGSPGNTVDDLINGLKDVLVNGNYTK